MEEENKMEIENEEEKIMSKEQAIKKEISDSIKKAPILKA